MKQTEDRMKLENRVLSKEHITNKKRLIEEEERIG